MIIAVVLALLPVATFAGTNVSCVVDGITHAHNTTFNTNSSGPCILYRCNNGGYIPESIKCLWNGQCYDLGETISENCVTRTCQIQNGTVEFAITQDACKNGDSCLQVGESVVNGCITTKCITSNGIAALDTEYRCEDDGVCRELGYERISNGGCVKQECKIQNGFFGFFTTLFSCQHGSSCLAVGASDVKECVNVTCVSSAGGIKLQSTVQCKDGDQCRPLGFQKSSGCNEYTCEHRTSGYGFFPTALKCEYDGGCVSVGESRTKDCTTRVCTNNNNTIGMVVTSQGCSWNGVCYPLGTQQQGQCANATCEIRNNQIGFFPNSESGCTIFGKCVGVGETITQDCITYICRQEGYSLITQFESAGCEYDGACHGTNTNVSIGCSIYRCEISNNTIGLKPVSKQCRGHDNACHSVGTVIPNGECNSLTCEERDGQLNFYSSELKCSFNGQCYAVNSSYVSNCITYTCSYTGNQLIMKPTVFQCKGEGDVCVDLGTPKVSGCTTMTCDNRNGSIGYFVTKEGCDDSGVCRDLGYVRSTGSGCSKQTCEKRNNMIGFYANADIECADDQDNGACKPIGTTRYYQGSCIQQECKSYGSGAAFQTSVKECRDSSDNSCKPIGSERTLANGCIVLECQDTTQGIGFQVTKEGCDNQGTCVNINATMPGSCPVYVCTKYPNGAIGFKKSDAAC